MQKFVLVDHSLKDLGGHYYTYASCVLAAAERAGFQPMLATHRDFHEFDALPRTWTAHAVFRDKSHSHRMLDAAAPPRGILAQWWERMRSVRRAREGLRIATGFAADCVSLFERVTLRPGDHVFLATASELDLDGLTRFLQSASPDYRDVDWHLQFHLGVFEGREPDYPAQSTRRQAMRTAFAQALQRVPEHRIRLYCTTEQLTTQFQALDVARFETLTYPVHPLFHRTDSDNARAVAGTHSARPARIACLGHSRREKGYKELPIIIRDLWKDYLGQGRAQLVMQTRRRDLRRALDAAVRQQGGAAAASPITYAPFPLDLERYAHLVRDTDIGLMLYDGTRYYARCSGVLLEMLCAGVPVIVPGGSWLSEQIAEVNQTHLEKLAARSEPIARIPVAAGEFDRRPAITDFDVPAGARSLLLRFRGPTPILPGTYIRLDLEQFDAHGTRVHDHAAISGPRANGAAVYVVFHLDAGAVRARLSWRNAWSDAQLTVTDVELLPLSQHEPAGAVGLTTANSTQCGELLDDMLRHMEHYRRCSAAFSAQSIRDHDASRIIAQVTRSPSATSPPLAHALAPGLDASSQTGG
jgi:hypothetical protein